MTSGKTLPAPNPPPKRKPADSPNTAAAVVKTKVSPAKAYADAYKSVWDALPHWKKLAIEDDRKNNVVDSRFEIDYIKEVNRVAEELM